MFIIPNDRQSCDLHIVMNMNQLQNAYFEVGAAVQFKHTSKHNVPLEYKTKVAPDFWMIVYSCFDNKAQKKTTSTGTEISLKEEFAIWVIYVDTFL